MLKQLYLRLSSLNLGLWLLSGVMLALAVGSFSRGSAEGAGLNEMPLFVWLQRAPLPFSWWLWITVVLIALLCLNTTLCTIEALKRKGRSIAPHLMHAGFLLIVVAHLFSAYGSFKGQAVVGQGGTIGFPGGDRISIGRISGETGMMGMMTSYQAEVRAGDKSAAVAPNHPMFHNGYGIYLKDVELAPTPLALFEVHREPGAPWALFGSLLFMAGNIMLLARRRNK